MDGRETSDDRVYGRENVGNSMGIAPERERHGSDDRVDGRETVGNSLGRAVGTGFTQSSFYTEELYTADVLHREACTQGGLYTQNLLHRELLYTGKVLHTEAFTQRSLCTG